METEWLRGSKRMNFGARSSATHQLSGLGQIYSLSWVFSAVK